MIDQALNDRLCELGIFGLMRDAAWRWLRGWTHTAEFECGCTEAVLANSDKTWRPHNRDCRGWMLARQFGFVDDRVECDLDMARRCEQALIVPWSPALLSGWRPDATRRRSLDHAREVCGNGEWAWRLYRLRLEELERADAADAAGMAAAQARDDAARARVELEAHGPGREVRWVTMPLGQEWREDG